MVVSELIGERTVEKTGAGWQPVATEMVDAVILPVSCCDNNASVRVDT